MTYDYQIFDLASSLGYSFSRSSHSTNEVVDGLAKHGTKKIVSFKRDFLPIKLYIVAYLVHVLVLYLVGMNYLNTLFDYSSFFLSSFRFWKDFSSFVLKIHFDE